MAVIYLKQPIGQTVGGWFKVQPSDTYFASNLIIAHYPRESGCGSQLNERG